MLFEQFLKFTRSLHFGVFVYFIDYCREKYFSLFSRLKNEGNTDCLEAHTVKPTAQAVPVLDKKNMVLLYLKPE